MTALLAHAGAGATWQAMVVVAAVVLAGAFLAAAVGRLELESPDDLILPIAGAAIGSSAAPLADAWLSDGIGWAVPVVVVSVAALLLGALSPLEVGFPAPLPMGAVALAGVTAVLLHPTLTVALHPPTQELPPSDDGQVEITAPPDGGHVDEGDVEVVVEVTGASIGPGGLDPEELPDDPEEAAGLAVAVAQLRDDGTTTQQRVGVTYAQTCTVEAPCTSVSFPLELEPGTYELTVDLTRGDGAPFAPFVRDRITFTVR